MWPNPFTGEIINGKLHFLCSDLQRKIIKISVNVKCLITAAIYPCRTCDKSTRLKYWMFQGC